MAFNPSGGGGDDFPPMAEINIIPLVDVMLVLLIISMVTTPFLEQGVNVDLPVAAGSSLNKGDSEDPVILFVAKDRNLRLGEKPVTLTDLKERLDQIFDRRKTKEIFVRADKEVPYGVVADIMSRVQQSGVERVGLVTQPQ